ncbi:MAG: ATP-dependent DNA helicase [Gammaproteobacteria bacterium]
MDEFGTAPLERTVAQEWFAKDGPLASQVERYEPRSGQIVMAQAVRDAIRDSQHLIVEAGTGTGKTFAYLLPVLMAGRKAVVSTGTRNLQDQLFHRDLPTVTGAFGQPVSVALLKGRSNYLCLYRLEQAGVQSDGKINRRQLGKVLSWSRSTDTGDTSELTDIAEGAPIWPWVTSTADNCLGQECPAFSDCHVMNARKAAQAADVVVVNHHLLLADIRLKEDGFGELLPGADVVVLDEAHQFPDTAANFFGARLSSRQINGITKDVVAESFAAGISRGELEAETNAVKSAAARVRSSLGSQNGRRNLNNVGATVLDAIADLTSRLFGLNDILMSFDGHSSGLDGCRRRARDAAHTLQQMMQMDESNVVAWIETTHTGFHMQRSPLDVSEQLKQIIEGQKAAWIFTSATLAVGDNFSHFAKSVGLDDAEALKVDSEFDYQKNSMLYVPTNMPEPSDERYTERVVELSVQLLSGLKGGAFLLFTSYRALNIAKDILKRESLPNRQLLVQGEQPRDELLRRFREDGRGVLLGTSSFWEGVDVRGSALGMVVIDKLPFASPGDPLLQARLDSMRKKGGNPFMDYQLPTAVLTLKQGVGRLIRDASDRGLCVVCDPRLYSKAYGRLFLNSLPPMPVERDLPVARRFAKGLPA